MDGMDINAIVRQAVQEYSSQEQARSEPAYKVELVEERRRREALERRLNELVEETPIVVLASHSTDLIKRVCNIVCWMEAGQVVMTGPPESVLPAYLNSLQRPPPKPRVVSGLDAIVQGQAPSADVIHAVSEAAHKQCRPLTNIPIDPDWRHRMVPVLVRRAFAQALGRTPGKAGGPALEPVGA